MRSEARIGGGLAAVSAALASLGGLGGEAAYAAAKLGDGLYEFLPRSRPDRKRGGYRGKRHVDRPRKRRNMVTLSKRVRRKHRRSGRR